jgi:dTDP-4-amino-4,6-dideoxygalactose transaminase
LIPFLGLQQQYQQIRGEIQDAITRVLESGEYVLGSEVARFEEEFAAYCGAAHAVAVNSGTSALHLALLASGVGPGDDVITVPYTFLATVAAIGYAEARAKLVDIDPATFNIDAAGIERAITPATRAILPVHLYGQPADMDPILEIARKRGLTVIEDSAQAHGACYRDQRVGSIGEMGCFSFYPSKNLGTYGEGGAIVTNDAACAQKLRMLRDWGQRRRYHAEIRGFNCRMEGLQGAILRVKLRYLEEWTEARRARACQYNALLAGVADVVRPVAMPWARHVYHLYTIRHPRRDALQQQLQSAGIESRVHYPVPIHLQPAYQDLGYHAGDFPHSEQACREVLSLPMYPELTAEQVESVASAIRSQA